MSIKDIVKRHDLLAFEIKLEFPAPVDDGKPQDYKVDMYLFVPESLDVNKQTYIRHDFYRSLKTNIRLSTPEYLLRNIVNGNDSPYEKLLTVIEKLMSANLPDTFANYEIEIKRLCSIFGSSLRNIVYQVGIVRHINDKQILVREFIEQSTEIRLAFKKLRNRINVLNHSQSFKLYEIADEYQSLLLEKHIYILINKLDKIGNFEEQIDMLIALAFDETRYRKSMGYSSVVGANKLNQDVLHRNSMLKKQIESNLFLNTDTRREALLAEQIMFAMAAGVAMVFATGVAFLSQIIYGRLSLPFFIALVISYMFKDRIKEVMRFYFDKKHKKFFADYKTNIYNDYKEKIGVLKESFRFIKKRHLPADVVEARRKMRKTDLDIELKNEKVMLFKNQIKLLNKQHKYNNFKGLTQILRYNIQDLTFKMDDPEKEVYYVRKTGLKQINVERIYYLNMVMCYTYNNNSVVKPYRVVATRKGIKRVEKYQIN